MRLQDTLRESWESLPPRTKRWTAIGGAGALLLLVVWVLMPTEGRQPRARNAEDVQRVRLSDRDTREVSLDALAAQITSLEAESTRLDRDIERLRNESGGRGRASSGMDEATEREIHALRENNMDLQRQIRELNQRIEDPSGRNGATAPSAASTREEVFNPNSAPDESTGSFSQGSRSPEGQGVDAPSTGRQEGGSILPPISDTRRRTGASSELRDTQIRVITASQPTEETEGAAAEIEGSGLSSHLPAGSIISGVLVTGMDAPTGQAGRRDPFPALLRVKTDAVLPNRMRADIRECFILTSGYGDLSSERAYLRGENLSCVREDGAVIESGIRGFAVGSDGKAGIRGRVVSKQGQLIARSLLSGFAEGVSNAFNLTNVPVISTDPTDRIQWQERMSSESLQAATLTGAGRAMERIANYYLEMAEGMYPVIEIDAGREIEFVLNGGLRIQGTRGEVTGMQPDRDRNAESE